MPGFAIDKRSIHDHLNPELQNFPCPRSQALSRFHRPRDLQRQHFSPRHIVSGSLRPRPLDGAKTDDKWAPWLYSRKKYSRKRLLVYESISHPQASKALATPKTAEGALAKGSVELARRSSNRKAEMQERLKELKAQVR